MDRNVIDIFTGQGFERPVVDDVAPEPDEPEEVSTPNEAMLEALRKIERMVLAGRVETLLICAQDSRTGYFVSDLQQPANPDRHELHGFVGLLQSITMELCEQSSMAPYVNLDGIIVDPYEEQVS